MIGLYEYDNASYENCIDDLNETLESLQTETGVDDYYESLETLERRGIRIQEIAKRLQELEEEECENDY